MRNAVDERSRFARARAGDDEKGAFAVGDGGGLFAVQLRGEIAGWSIDGPFSGRIDPRRGRGGLVGHRGNIRCVFGAGQSDFRSV